MKRREFAALSISTVSMGVTGCLGGSDEPSSADDSDNVESSHQFWLDEDGYIDPVDADWGVEQTRPEDPGTFRSWLNGEQFDPERNLWFEYTVGYEPAVFQYPDFLENPEDTVEGTVLQHGNQIHLGTFDVDAIRSAVADANDHERTGERGSFTIVDERIAVGSDVIIVGMDAERLEIPLELYAGDREQLEVFDPVFTRVFEELPDDHSIAAQYGLPPGADLDVEGLYVMGMANPPGELPEEYDDPIETTWVFCFPDESDLTDETLAELETLAETVDHSEIDGKVARIEGAGTVLG